MLKSLKIGVVIAAAMVALAGCKTTGSNNQSEPWQTVGPAGFPYKVDFAKLSDSRRAIFENAVITCEKRPSLYYTIYRHRQRVPGHLLVYVYAPLQPGAGWNEPDSIRNWARKYRGAATDLPPYETGSFGSEFGRMEYIVYARGGAKCLSFRSYFGVPGGDNRLAGTKLVQGDYCGQQSEAMGETEAREIAGALVIE